MDERAVQRNSDERRQNVGQRKQVHGLDLLHRHQFVTSILDKETSCKIGRHFISLKYVFPFSGPLMFVCKA